MIILGAQKVALRHYISREQRRLAFWEGAARGGDLPRGVRHKLGRFLICRRIYSATQAWVQSKTPNFYERRLSTDCETIFDRLAVNETVEHLRRDGIAVGLSLPSSLVSEIQEFAKQNPCWQPGVDREFVAAAVRDGRTPDGDHVEHGMVTRVNECAAIQRVGRDPLLIAIARAYLNYWPNRVLPRLTWNFSSSRTADQRASLYPPIQFHYDVLGYNCISALFFLSNTSAKSGSHVMIKGSHVNKPVWMLFHKGTQSEKAVRSYYKQEDELVLSGDAGFGFVEDVSCIHRVIPASGTDRLILIVRYL